MIRATVRAATAALWALSLAGCVDSSGPILTDARPLFGKDLRLQFYTLRKGFADEPEQALFKWDGDRYIHAGGGMNDVTAFTVHRLEGRAYIVRARPPGDQTSSNMRWHTSLPKAFSRLPRLTRTMPTALRVCGIARG